MTNEKNAQRVIITGAGGNLGKTVTEFFLTKGCYVIATVRKDSDKMKLPSSDRLDVRVLDLSDESATSAFVQESVQQYGKIDAALMLAGGFAAGNIEETTGAKIRQQAGLNFETAYHLARPLLKHMVQQNYGRLVFVGARPALKPSAGKNMIAYSLAKSLLFRLAECINEEVKGKNITASVIVPSTIDTKDNRESMPDADVSKWVSPESIADILFFIISQSADPLRDAVYKVYNKA
jgi:NAD(P)-dependent dehydrogenase (short-subunit alcohol dehydrogenase family)